MSADSSIPKPVTNARPAPEAAAADEARAGSGQGWLQALRSRLGMSGQQTLRDTIEYALRDEDETAQAFSAEERAMLLRLLRFGASRVEDIMVPRADIIALEEAEPIHELLRTFEEAGVSRIPLYHETLDDPRGMIHVKDLFRWLMAETQGREPVLPVGKPGAAPPQARCHQIGDADDRRSRSRPLRPGPADLGRHACAGRCCMCRRRCRR